MNAASKLGEDTAQPWEILATEALINKLTQRDGLSFVELPETPPGADRAYRIEY